MDDGGLLIWDHLRTQGADKARRLEYAIERGLIRWHGLPYTLHSELMSRDLFAVGLTYSADLDRQFGTVTRAAKMTDVPGHSRGIVPVLAEAGSPICIWASTKPRRCPTCRRSLPGRPAPAASRCNMRRAMAG